MFALTTVLALTLGAPVPPTPATLNAPARELEFDWRGSDHPVSSPPEALSEPAREALAWWAPFAEEHGYGLFLDDDARVLFVAAKPKRKTLELIDRTTAFFDERLPAEAGLAADQLGDTASAESASAPVAEGPGQEPGRSELAATTWTTQWGAGTAPLDHDTIVMLAVDEEHYGAAIDNVAAREEWLGDWASAARSSLGFVLEYPLVGAFVLGNHENEEFDPDGELVHRLTDLLIMRRFGRQPYWMVQGAAWHAEVELRRGIYCYPYRREFVFTVEHGAWTSDVRNRVKREFKKEVVGIGDIAGLRRGTWNSEAALMAYGTMAWLMEERSEQLVPLMHDLREAWETGSRIDLGGHDWKRDTSYEVPDDVLAALMLEHLGDGVFAELTKGLKSLR